MDQFFDLLDQTSIGIISFQKSGSVIKASQTFTEITGLAKEDFTNEEEWKKLIFPDPIYRDLLVSLWDQKEKENRTLGNNKSPQLETRMTCRNGLCKEIQLTKITLIDTVWYLLEDVTNQNSIKAKLVESENTLRLFVENSPAALAMLDRDLRYIIVSKRWYEDYQLTAKDVIGKKHYDVFPEVPDRWKKIHARCLTGVVEKSDEDFLERENGEVAWLKWEIQPWYLSNGAVGGLIFLTDVITEKKLAAKAIETSEANFRTILQTTDTAYLLLDKELRVKTFNQLASQYAKAIFNHDVKIGDYLPDSVSSDRREIIKDKLSQVLLGHQVEYSAKIGTSENREIWIFNRFLPIKAVDGSLLGVMLATRDISDQKKEEFQRDRLMSDLIQHNKELEQFAYIVSHNLRIPVSNIISIIDALSINTLAVDERSQFQTYLLESANNLDEIIRDLNFILKSKKEHSDQRETVDLNEIIKQIISRLEEDIQKSKISILFDFSEAPNLHTVKGVLYTILSNIISNCIKFRSNEKPPQVKLVSSIDNNFLILTISDNGQGIDTKKHGDQIFGLYKRFHLSTEGKGIGLYLVKSLIEALGGRVNLRSKINQGTEITLRLPLNIAGI